MTEATPLRLPWKRDVGTRIADSHGHQVADFLGFAAAFGATEEQRLEYAITAVNAHDGLVKALRAVEWSGLILGECDEDFYGGDAACPSCKGRKPLPDLSSWRKQGHTDDCQLAAALAGESA